MSETLPLLESNTPDDAEVFGIQASAVRALYRTLNAPGRREQIVYHLTHSDPQERGAITAAVDALFFRLAFDVDCPQCRALTCERCTWLRAERDRLNQRLARGQRVIVGLAEDDPRLRGQLDKWDAVLADYRAATERLDACRHEPIEGAELCF